MGKLIVIDGLDGSGKTTQVPLVAQLLREQGEKVLEISYPDYGSDSSALVKMYLNGELCDSVDGVNAYAASSFYAVDRYASFKKEWENYYNGGYTVIAARYTTSNAIHQMTKLDKSEWDGFLSWLDDYEYEKLAIPRPDKVVFLDMSRSVADRLISLRYCGDEQKKDLHEKNMEYLSSCCETALYAAEKQGWSVIKCDDGENPYPLEKITAMIFEEVNGRRD